MSSSAALLGQDFGSESEDENFNPAPADESDNEAAGDSDAEVNIEPNSNGVEPGQRPAKEQQSEDDIENKQGIADVRVTGQQSNGRGASSAGDGNEGDANESGAEDLGGALEDEEDDDDEDEDEDPDDAVSVGLPQPKYLLYLTSDELIRVGPGRESAETRETSTLTLKPRWMKKMKATRKMKRDRRIPSLPTHTPMTFMLFHWVVRRMIGDTENSIASANVHSKWMRRSKRNV